MNSRVTLARVAAEAGVSPATVSKVVNGRVGVSSETRRAVEQVIENTGYVGVSERERPIRGKREPLVEVMVDQLDSPYTLTLLAGAVSIAESFGAAVVTRRVCAIEDEPPLQWAERLARTGRVGVLEVTSAYSPEREAALRSVGLPMLLVDPLDAPRMATRSVGATNWAGGVDATKHLVDLGHTEIGYIGGPVTAAADIARRHGFVAGMEMAGLQPNAGWEVHGPFTFAYGLEAALTLLSRPHRPTAVFAASDLTALGVLEAARRLGMLVPLDLSVVAFDDTLLAKSSAPALTAVHHPIFEMGQTAVTTIMRLATGDVSTAKRVELATHLVVRDSTAPPREH